MLTSVRKYYGFKIVFSACMGATFTLYVPWLHSLGLTQAEVLFINAVFWLMTFFAELPTGMIADGRGRGFSLAMGSLAWAGGALTYFFATGFWSALLGECALAIGQAFYSGAITAWMNSAPDKPDDLRSVLARAEQFSKVAVLVSVFLVPYVTPISPSGFWMVSSILALVLAIFAWIGMHDGGEEHPLSEWEALDEALAYVRASGIAHWNLTFQFLLSTMQWFNLGWAVASISLVGEWVLPWMWVLITLSHLVGAEIARRHPDWQSATGLALALFAAWLPMIVFFGTTSVGVYMVAVALHELARGFIWPAHDAYQLKGIPQKSQSTVLSIYALMDDIMLAFWSLCGAAVYSLLGVTDAAQIMFTWAAIALVTMLGAMLLLRFRSA